MMNRRGSGEEIMFFAFFVIWTIVAGGLYMGVSAFFGQGYDGRVNDAQSLADKVIACFQKEKFFESGFGDKFLVKCGLNGNVNVEHLVYIESTKDVSKKFVFGVSDYRNQCYFNAAKNNKVFPQCVRGTFVKDGESFTYIVGSNNRGKSVAI